MRQGHALIRSTVDEGLARDQHVGMGDDDDDEIFADDQDLATFEQQLFAAIRESHRLDAEIDDEYRRLAKGEYDEPSIPEWGSDGDGEN